MCRSVSAGSTIKLIVAWTGLHKYSACELILIHWSSLELVYSRLSGNLCYDLRLITNWRRSSYPTSPAKPIASQNQVFSLLSTKQAAMRRIPSRVPWILYSIGPLFQGCPKNIFQNQYRIYESLDQFGNSSFHLGGFIFWKKSLLCPTFNGLSAQFFPPSNSSHWFSVNTLLN